MTEMCDIYIGIAIPILGYLVYKFGSFIGSIFCAFNDIEEIKKRLNELERDFHKR